MYCVFLNFPGENELCFCVFQWLHLISWKEKYRKHVCALGNISRKPCVVLCG